MYGVVQASPEEQIVPDLFCLFIPSTESICHIPQELRLVTVLESGHPRQSRVICSFMEVAAILTMWLFILAMVRLYMPATRPPVLLSPMLSIEVLSVLQDFLEIKGLQRTGAEHPLHRKGLYQNPRGKSNCHQGPSDESDFR